MHENGVLPTAGVAERRLATRQHQVSQLNAEEYIRRMQEGRLYLFAPREDNLPGTLFRARLIYLYRAAPAATATREQAMSIADVFRHNLILQLEQRTVRRYDVHLVAWATAMPGNGGRYCVGVDIQVRSRSLPLLRRRSNGGPSRLKMEPPFVQRFWDIFNSGAVEAWHARVPSPFLEQVFGVTVGPGYPGPPPLRRASR